MKRIGLILLVFLAIASHVNAANLVWREDFDDYTCTNGQTCSVSNPTLGGTAEVKWQGRETPALYNTDYTYASPGRDGTGKRLKGNLNKAIFWRWLADTTWPTQELYVSFYQKFDTYVVDDPGLENYKIFRPNFNQAGGGGVATLEMSVAKSNQLYIQFYNSDGVNLQSGWPNVTLPITDGNWRRFEIYINFTTKTVKIWYAGSLVFNRTDSRWLATNVPHYLTALSIDGSIGFPYGGSFTRSLDDLEFWDGLPTGDGNAPYASQHSPTKNATGIPKSNRTISFHIQDDNVVSTSGNVTIEGNQYTCGSGITCTGLNTNNMTITYIKGSDWDFDQVVNISTTGFKDPANNTMLQDTWQFTVASDNQASLNIATTTLPNVVVGSSVTQGLSATGGTQPYIWDNIAGTLPTGRSLSTSGNMTGVYTETGTFNFTVRVTDSASATDNQALSQFVSPTTPTGQTSVVITNLEDTHIISGILGDTNRSTWDNTEVYQYPIGTVANRILNNISISSLPANIVITAASLEMYMMANEGSGATNPMRVYVYPILDNVPVISTATWNNFTGTLGTAESYQDVSLIPGWYSWSVLGATQAAHAAGTPLYLALDGGLDGASNTNRIFTSVNHSNTTLRPRLKVTYTQMSGSGSSSLTPGKMKFRAGSKGRWRAFR